MNVLSLFDGMSCGQIALNNLGIDYDKYFACEIDTHAIKVTQSNFPNTIQLGDVTKVDFKSLPQITLLMGGSPCQGFSFAGKQLNFDDPRSKLFFEFVRALKETKPKYFLLENVKMKRESQDVISQHLGVEPIEINSALVSAQNRKRLYWTNIPGLDQPKDRGIFLKDIIETPESIGVIKNHGELELRPHKSQCLDANYFKGVDNHGQRTMILNYSSSGRGDGVVEGRFTENPDKAMTLTASGYSNRSMTGVVMYDGLKSYIRKLTVTECKRLQTVPENYSMPVSDSQAYKMLGNGWTVDVISHILKNAFEEKWNLL